MHLARRCATIWFLSALCSCGCTPADGMTDAMPDLAVFQDPDSDFSTTDVVDVEGEVIRFDSTAGRLIWVADGSTFNGWTIEGNDLQGGAFVVRFGSEGGTPKAYFTEDDPPTICDLVVEAGQLTILPTDTTVPRD